MSTAEPVVAIFALRTFRVSANGYPVPATQYSNEWATGTAIARCNRFHRAPDDDCTCGLYLVNNVYQLRTQYQHARRILAVIALEGELFKAPKGGAPKRPRVIDIWTAPLRRPHRDLSE